MTPSLNKSFKFQSDWPYNNSQVYLLTSILEDLLEDEDREFKTKDDGYYFASTVHYPNNKSLMRQKVYMDKDGNITKVEVVDKEDNVQIVMEFQKQEFNKKFDKNYFELSELLEISNKKDNSNSSLEENNSSNNNQETTDENQKITDNGESTEEITNENNNTNGDVTNNTTTSEKNSNSNHSMEESADSTNQATNGESKTKQTATIDDVIYPMYLPNNTYLTSQETIDTENGQRLILTFGGDSSFILVEETIQVADEGMIIPVSGEFDFLSDVIGVIGTNSLTWHSNGIEYYMVSESIETSELVEIARSISVLPVSK